MPRPRGRKDIGGIRWGEPGYAAAQSRAHRAKWKAIGETDPLVKAEMRLAKLKTERAWLDKNYKKNLCDRANRRGKQAGLAGRVAPRDLEWPEFCPILGIQLDYHTAKGSRRLHSLSNPSLDRWDNSKGYEPGNVFVISCRANWLKRDGTAEELEKVANYARHKPRNLNGLV